MLSVPLLLFLLLLLFLGGGPGAVARSAGAGGPAATDTAVRPVPEATSAAPAYVSAGAGGLFAFKGKPLFLSGANLAWINYGADYGNNQTSAVRCGLEAYVNNVSAAGGNALRVWVFVEGQTVPVFDPQTGLVTATDATHSMADDLRALLRYAASKNVFVMLTLWNGALMRVDAMKNLIHDPAKLQSFIDHALVPLATALKEEPALLGYEIMNEPEGSVLVAANASDPCFDTKNVLQGSGAGWAGSQIEMYELLRFHNLQAGALKRADPNHLVTVGAWSEYSSTSQQGLAPGRKFFNYYADECLVKAGGDKDGVLDFYQIHTYAHGGTYDPGSPFGASLASRGVAAYGLSKPVVVGEFSAGSTGGRRSIASLYADALSRGFAGAWDWSLVGGDGNDDEAVAVQGMESLKGNKEVVVDIDGGGGGGGGGDTCSCADTPPPGQSYTCAQQASWGKCGYSWMKGYCCRSCFACNAGCGKS